MVKYLERFLKDNEEASSSSKSKQKGLLKTESLRICMFRYVVDFLEHRLDPGEIG